MFHRNRITQFMSLLLMFTLLLAGCGGNEAENEMQFVSKETIKADMEAEDSEYLLLDVRKIEDFNESRLKNSYVADQDAANKGGDDAQGIANLKETLKEVTGSETGDEDTKYALVCYSGGSYAQKGLDLMVEMGIDKDQIYTLEGGMKEWEKGGDEYKSLIE